MTLIDDIKRDREAGTPGDWQVGNRYCGNSVYSSTNGDEIVANTHGSQRNFRRDEQIRQQDANARRIARVPQMEAALLAAEELAEAQENYIAAVHAYEATPTDRGGVYGAKGTARTLMHTRYGLMQAALAAFRKALEAAA